MWLLLFWFVCAILSAVVASNKGRGGVGWFIVGFLFGPFGFILALVVSDQSITKAGAYISAKGNRPAGHTYNPVIAAGKRFSSIFGAEKWISDQV